MTEESTQELKKFIAVSPKVVTTEFGTLIIKHEHEGNVVSWVNTVMIESPSLEAASEVAKKATGIKYLEIYQLSEPAYLLADNDEGRVDESKVQP